MNNQKLQRSPVHRVVAALAIAALLTTSFGSAVAQKTKSSSSKPQTQLTEEQRILHVLNRLGFGARPGDVERVKSMGLEKYINLQLEPDKISDEVAVAKVKNLSTLNMTTAELYEKFPQPGQLLRQLERRGELPKELAEARQNRNADNPPPDNSMERPEPNSPSGEMTPRPNDQDPRNNQDYRRAIREYYRENGLGQPQRITADLQASRILRAVYSERQLNEVMVDFWTNHFNVFAGKGADRWLLVSYDRDTIRPHAMGKFSELLQATAQSPAMLFYLDNFQSVDPNMQPMRLNQQRRQQRRGLFGMLGGDSQRPARDPSMRREEIPQLPPEAQRQRRGINENYARELMELHTLGVDGGYTQKDVQEVARCFTGWTIFAPRGGGAAVAARFGDGAPTEVGKFFFNRRAHDDGEKTVLGQKIPSGGGMKDGLAVLDILARHPSTAKHIATKLVRYFVADEPPAALVDRVAATFTKTNGDIPETLRAVFFSPEFNSAEAYRAKVKRPFELAISAIRTLGGDTNGGPQLHQWIARMGEPLYGYQTPNGYSDSAESWVNSGGLVERLNFGLTLASNRIPGTRVDLQRFLGETPSADKPKIMDRFLDQIIGGEVSQKTKTTLLKQLDQETPANSTPPPPPPPDNSMPDDMNGRGRRLQLARAEANVNDPITKIVGLILGSPEFQRQ